MEAVQNAMNSQQEANEKIKKKVFKPEEYSFHKVIAVALWLRSVHFLAVITLFSIIFLSLPQCHLVFGFLLLLMLIPIDENHKYGRKLARFCFYLLISTLPDILASAEVVIFLCSYSHPMLVEDTNSKENMEKIVYHLIVNLSSDYLFSSIFLDCVVLFIIAAVENLIGIFVCTRVDTLHVEDFEAFVRSRAYVFGYEPHLVWPIGIIALVDLTGFLPLPKLKVLASSTVFRTPFMRYIWTWLGLAPVSRKSFASVLRAGYSCIIVPGGVREAFLMEHGIEIFFRLLYRCLCFSASIMPERDGEGRSLVPVFFLVRTSVLEGQYTLYVPSNAIPFMICAIGKSLRECLLTDSGTLYDLIIYPVLLSPTEIQCMSWWVDQSSWSRIHDPLRKRPIQVNCRFAEALQYLFGRHKEEVGHADVQLKIL